MTTLFIQLLLLHTAAWTLHYLTNDGQKGNIAYVPITRLLLQKYFSIDLHRPFASAVLDWRAFSSIFVIYVAIVNVTSWMLIILLFSLLFFRLILMFWNNCWIKWIFSSNLFMHKSWFSFLFFSEGLIMWTMMVNKMFWHWGSAVLKKTQSMTGVIYCHHGSIRDMRFLFILLYKWSCFEIQKKGENNTMYNKWFWTGIIIMLYFHEIKKI